METRIMHPNVLIEQADSHVAAVDELCAQYRHTVEQDKRSLDEPAPVAERRRQVRERLAPVREYLKQAGEVLRAIAPVPEPERVSDPLTLYRREHELFAMAPERRAAVFQQAVEDSDRVTFDVVVAAAKQKPWLELVPTLAVEYGVERWADRHHPHPAAYVTLRDAVERVDAALRRVRCACGEGV
jgi:hypothetical protein